MSQVHTTPVASTSSMMLPLTGSEASAGLDLLGLDEPRPLLSEETLQEEQPRSSSSQPAHQPSIVARENERRRRIGTQWLMTQPLARLVSLRMCLKPFCTLLSTYITRSGQKWAKAQRGLEAAKLVADGSGSGGSSPIQEYLALTAEHDFFKALGDLRADDTWRPTPRTSWSLSYQAMLFRTLSRMGAVIHELLVVPTEKYPLKLLKVLLSGEGDATELAEVPECCLDDFSKGYLAAFAGGQLRGAESQAVLQAICACASTDTVNVEWGHGRVNRLISATANQSHRPSLELIAAQWLCKKHHQRRSSLCTAPRAAEGEIRAGAASSEQPEVERPQKKRRGGGGSFRAFLSMSTRGQKGRPDLKQVSHQYVEAKRLNTPDYQQATVMGAAATQRHREHGVPSFGPTTRAWQRKRLPTLKTALGKALWESRFQAAGIGADAGDPDTPTFSLDLKAEIRAVRKAAMVKRRLAKEVEDKQMQELAKFCQEVEGEGLESCLDTVQGLIMLRSSLHFVPSCSFAFLEVVPNTYLQNAIAVASWASATSRTCNLKAALQHGWRRRHQTITAIDTAEKETKPAPKPCLQYGVCLCSEEGRQVWNLRIRFLRLLKLCVHSKEPEHRSMLQGGHLVVRLLKASLAKETSSWEAYAASWVEESSREAAEWAEGPEVWLHIALHYFKPYRPAFQLVHRLPTEDDHRIPLPCVGVLTDFHWCWCIVAISW